MGTPQIWDGHEGRVSPGAQIPAGMWPPPCQHPQSGLAQLSLLQCHSQSQFKPARPQSIPAQAAGGAQLQSPHTQMHTHLQISPVICLVNSFSLEGQRVAAKHYQPNQTILSPETSRGGCLACRPPQTPSLHRGAGDGRPSSADTLQHHRDKSPPCLCSLWPHNSSHAAHPTPMDSPLSQLCGCFRAKTPKQAPHAPQGWCGSSHLGGAHHTAPRVCRQQGHTVLDSGLCHSLHPSGGVFWTPPRPIWLQFPVLSMQRQGWGAVGYSLPEIPAFPSALQAHPTLSRGQFRGLPVPLSPLVTSHRATQVDTYLTNFRAKDFSFPVAAAAASSKSRLFPDSM